MNLKNKVKSYSFWISLISAILIVVRIVGEHFNWFINESFIMDVVTAVCGVLVLLGILSAPSNSNSETNMETLGEQSKKIQQKQNELNSTIKEDIMAEKLTIQEQIELLKSGLNKNEDATQNVATEQPQNWEENTEEESKENIESASGDNTAITESCSVQMCANDETAPNLCVEDSILEPVQEMPQTANVVSAEPSQDSDKTGWDNLILGMPQEVENSTNYQITDIASAEAVQEMSQTANEIERQENDETAFRAQNQETLSQGQEAVLYEVLSNLDKSQLKALLMDILMRL